MLYLGALFLAKVLDNALSTTKTILIQRSRWVLAGIAVILSDFLYFWVTKRIVSADSMLALAVVVIGGGAGWYFKIYRPKKQRAAESEADYGSEYDGSEDYDETAPEDDGPPWDEDGEE